MAVRARTHMNRDAGEWFARRYGREPEGAWFAPGRVNLIGGPDYNEVFVLPFALGAGVTAAAARRSDRRIALVSRHVSSERVLLDIDALEPGSVGGWAAYPACTVGAAVLAAVAIWVAIIAVRRGDRIAREAREANVREGDGGGEQHVGSPIDHVCANRL